MNAPTRFGRHHRPTIAGFLALAAVMAGCGGGAGSPAPPTAKPSGSWNDPDVPAAAADSVLAGVDEVRSSGFPTAETAHTETAPPNDALVDPGHPCSLMSVGAISTSTALGGDLSAFRQMHLSSSKLPEPVSGVYEVIAVYPNKTAAQSVFQHLTKAFDQCRAHPEGPSSFTFGMENPVRLAWTVGDQRPGMTGAIDVHLTRNVVYGAWSTGVGDDIVVAKTVADQIKTNIIDPA